MENSVRNYIFNTWMGEQLIGSAFVLPFVEPPEPAPETSSSTSKRDRKKGEDDGPTSKKLSKRQTPTKSIGKVAPYICWVCIGRSPSEINRDAAYSGTWSALHTLKQYNRTLAQTALRDAAASKKDKHGTMTASALAGSPAVSPSSSSSSLNAPKKKLTKVALYVPVFSVDPSIQEFPAAGAPLSPHGSSTSIGVGSNSGSSSNLVGTRGGDSSSKGDSSSPTMVTHATPPISSTAFHREAVACVYQASLALKNFMTPAYEPHSEEAVDRLNHSIFGRTSLTTQEREKELDGLMFSREIESRGLCNEEELDILIAWVNAGAAASQAGASLTGGGFSDAHGNSRASQSFSSGDNSVSRHSLSAARALVSLLRRPDTEFTLRSDQICEKVISKSAGCLTRLLEMGQSGEIELHREIPRSDLEIGAKIGDGNAGSVYRAKWRGPGSTTFGGATSDGKGIDVAVKLFSKGSVQNSQDFMRELSLLSLIQHPLIVNCYGGSTRQGDEYIVEELMEASVYDLLHDKKFVMDEEMRLDFAISTARCMNFLHNCGVIHRDLKSLNLLVSKNYQVKVCDFGLSRVIDSKNQMTSNIGTVSWVAPELFAKKLYTEKADVYSYAIILWELVTRQMPFGDIEAFSVPLMVSRGERPDLSKDIPIEWRKLIKACWHQKPTSRPAFKKILVKLRSMLTTLREERGEQVVDRGQLNRNSAFLLESDRSMLGLGGMPGAFSDDTKNASSSAPYPSDSKSDSEYSSENLASTFSTISLSASNTSASGTPSNSKKEKRSH